MLSAISPTNIPGHLLELINEVVWTATLDGQHLLYANPALERVYGRPAADFYENMGLWLEMVHPDDRAGAEQSGRELLAHGHSEATYRIVRPDGDIRWLLDRKHVIYDEGQPQYLGGIAADITTQKQTEQALRESETQYRLLFEKSGDGILLTASEGQILTANPAACKMFGRTEAEICRLGRAGLVDPTDTRLAAALQQRAQTGNVQGELNLLRADGSSFPTEITSSSYQNQLGHPRNSLIIRDISERKRLENELQISLEKYRVLFETFPLGITISDADGQIIESNPAAERILGLPTAEQQQRDIDSSAWQIIRPDGSPLPAEEYASVRALREQRLIENMEMGVMKGAGETAWISVTAAPLPVAGYGVAIAYIDITKRKQAEQALRDNEEKYRALFNNELYAIAILDPETLHFLDVNEAFTRLYGYGRAELLAGMTATQLVVDGDQLLTAFRQTSQDGTYFIPLRHHLKKDGSTFPVEVVGGPYTWQNRRVRFSIVHNISVRIKAEQSLQESERKFRSIIEKSADAVILADESGRLIEWNPAAERLFGRSRAEVLGWLLWEQLFRISPPSGQTPERYEQLKAEWQRYFQTGQHPSLNQMIELNIALPDGRQRQVESTRFSVPTERGFLLGAVIRDVTERKQAQAERERLLDELQTTLAHVKQLSGLLPICSNCKKIRDDQGYWQQVEVYVRDHSEAEFSHGICPDCMQKLYPRDVYPFLYKDK